MPHDACVMILARRVKWKNMQSVDKLCNLESELIVPISPQGIIRSSSISDEIHHLANVHQKIEFSKIESGS